MATAAGSLDGSVRRAGGLDGDLLLGTAGGREVDRRLVGVRLLAVVGLDLVGMALLPARLALGELLVQVSGVEEHEGRQLDGPGRRVDRPAKPALDEERQQAAVVEVGVGQHDGVELRGVEPERDPVADGLVGAALEHAAVDEDAGPLGLRRNWEPVTVVAPPRKWICMAAW